MSNEFDSIFNDLSAIRDENHVSVSLASNNAVVDFLPISVLQQKQIINSISNSAIDNLRITNALNKIILDNVVHQANQNNAAYIRSLDRDIILLALDADSESDVSDMHLDAAHFNSTCINYRDVITVWVQSPSLFSDSSWNSEFIKLNENKDAADLTAEFFVCDIVKHITQLKIKDQTVVFDDISSYTLYCQIIEMLPADLNKMITKFINDGKKCVSDFLKSKNAKPRTPLA